MINGICDTSHIQLIGESKIDASQHDSQGEEEM